ncbi:Decapping 5-like protein, partial [Mucuna pruriens]
MASEFGANGSSTSSSNSEESYIGCFISLISKCEIRYEGVLYFLNIQDSTIGLKNGKFTVNVASSSVKCATKSPYPRGMTLSTFGLIMEIELKIIHNLLLQTPETARAVRSYGTEGRRKNGPQVPPSDTVYEYILFRGNDIKNLQIKSPSTSSKSEEQIFSDPAIIQSQYSGLLSSPVASVGGRSMTESIQRQDSPVISSKAFPVVLPSHQSVTQLGPSNSPAATQVASHPSFSTAMYWQGPSGISSSSSHSLLQSSSLHPPSMAASLAVQNQMQNAETQVPTTTKGGWIALSECGLPVSSAMTSLVNLTHSPSLTSLKFSDSLDIPSLLSTKTPVPYSASMTFDGSNMPQFSSPLRDINFIDAQISGNICPDPRLIHPRHSVHHSAPSFVDSTSGPLPPAPLLLTPDQFAHPREQLFSLTRNLNPNQKDMGSLTQTSSGSTALMPSPASQAPLLPLPTSVQKPQYTAPQFTEEFDFEAMNEKFKKDEVWGSLGKATTKIGVEDNASLNLVDRECNGMIPNPKSAYKKDDFFDTISCNSLTRGSRNGQSRFSERMKLDTETFGNFQQRPNFSHGGYGAGRGENFRGSYNWGRGYGYSGRGRGLLCNHRWSDFFVPISQASVCDKGA